MGEGGIRPYLTGALQLCRCSRVADAQLSLELSVLTRGPKAADGRAAQGFVPLLAGDPGLPLKTMNMWRPFHYTSLPTDVQFQEWVEAVHQHLSASPWRQTLTL